MSTPPAASAHSPSRGAGFWVGLVVGWPLIAFGAWGILHKSADTQPTDLVRWLFAGALVHDLIVAPVVCGVGWLLSRILPARVRGPVTAGLLISGVVTLFSWPFLREYGARPDNPSVLPNDEAAGLLTVLAAVWVVCAALAARAWFRGAADPPE